MDWPDDAHPEIPSAEVFERDGDEHQYRQRGRLRKGSDLQLSELIQRGYMPVGV